jgi:hypothetical protein
VKKTLVLNASYEPLSVVGWKRGFILCNCSIDDKPSARVEKNYDERIEVGDDRVFYKPAVIILRRQISVRPKRVKLTHPAIFKRDSYTCQYCEKKCSPDLVSIDHIIPKSLGGRNIWRNLVAACKPCNNKKSNQTLDECGMELIRLPFTPVWPNNLSTPEEWEEYMF